MFELKRGITFAVAVPFAIALCGLVVGAVFCAGSLHVARKFGPAPRGATTVVMTARDGASLSAWWLRAPKPNGDCVVVLHGISDSRVGSAGFASIFVDGGYAVLLPDSRGHGASGGRFITYGLLEKFDVIDWASQLRKMGCQKTYGFGESMGASILIQAASMQPAFAAIVAECPYADLFETAEYRTRQMLPLPPLFAHPLASFVVMSGMLYARWVDGLDFRQVSPMRSIALASTPILLIHGLDDHRTPPMNSKLLASANPRDPLWLVPNAGHTGAFAASPIEFRSRVLSWFATH